MLLAKSLLASMLWLGAAPAVAQDDSPADDGYDAALTAALAEFEIGNWEEARALFARAHEIRPSARTYRGIGMAAFEARDYLHALSQLRAALSDQRRPLNEAQRRQTESLVERALGFLDRVIVVPESLDAEVRIDGAPTAREADGSVLVDLGARRVELVVGERVVAEREIVVRGGGEHTISPTEHAPGRGPVARVDWGPWPAVTTISGAVLVVAGAVLGGVGVRDYNTVADAERRTEWAELRDHARRAPRLTGVGWAALGVGGVALVVGIVAMLAAPATDLEVEGGMLSWNLGR